MTRHKPGAKEKGAKGRGMAILSQADIRFAEHPVDVQPNKPKKKLGRPRKHPIEEPVKIVEPQLVESDHEEEEMALTQLPKTKSAPQLMKLFKKLGKYLHEFVSEVHDTSTLNKCLLGCGIQDDDERTHEVENNCTAILELFRDRRTPKEKTVAQHNPSKRNPHQPGTPRATQKYFTHRAPGNVVTLCGPVETIKATASIMQKAFGFIRIKGKPFPLMHALSGYKNIVAERPPHMPKPKILDSLFWAEEVYRLRVFTGEKMKKNRWNRKSGDDLPKELDFCSHVETKLMVWFAMWWLVKVTGNQDVELADLFTINHKGMPDPPEAELYLDRDHACEPCYSFKKRMEKNTGIIFHFHFFDRVGTVKPEKDKHNNIRFPLHANYDELESSGDEVEEESRFVEVEEAEEEEVVIPRALSQRKEVTKTKTIVSRIDIKRFMFNAAERPSKNASQHYHHQNLETDDEIYVPARQSKTHAKTISERQITTRTKGLLGPQVPEQKKRKASLSSSAPSSKRAQHIFF